MLQSKVVDEPNGTLLRLRHANQASPLAKTRIKLEIDTNPPSGSGAGLLYLDFPFVSAVAVQDQPSLFAGKLHALLCREYVKGRDWYDFILYTSQGIGVNYAFLTSAINQLGPWQGRDVAAHKNWVVSELKKKITSINWKQAVNDVRRFIRVNEQPSLDLWGRDLFLNQLAKWERSTG